MRFIKHAQVSACTGSRVQSGRSHRGELLKRWNSRSTSSALIEAQSLELGKIPQTPSANFHQGNPVVLGSDAFMHADDKLKTEAAREKCGGR